MLRKPLIQIFYLKKSLKYSRFRLWVMTVNALQPSAKIVRQQKYTQNDLMIDPLIVLRCDQRVYR